MQAILVKFIGPTNTRPSRYKASCAAGSLTLSSDHGLNPQDNAARVAVALCKRYGWIKPYYGDLVCGDLKDGSYVFVMDGDLTERYPIASSACQPINV